MAARITLFCDQCLADAQLSSVGTITDARVEQFRYGWFYTGEKDLCPVCSGRDPHYFDTEPF